MRARYLLLLASAWAPACSFVAHEVRAEPYPLADMEESLAHTAEPADEAARLALDAGSFTGVVLAEVRATLDEMLGDAAGVEVARVIENSPADMAGLRAGDLILGVVGGAEARSFAWPSEWREFELATAPGSSVKLRIDRDEVELEVQLVLEARVRPAPREAIERFEELQRVGVRLRTPTEVEARAAGLAPGAGALIVGLSRGSPWRKAELAPGDLVVALDGAPLAHPEQLLAALRRPGVERVELEVLRQGQRREVSARLSEREDEFTESSFPLLWSYESERGRTTTSLLLGLIKWETTAVAWEVRLFWFLTFGGGESDRLEEVDA